MVINLDQMRIRLEHIRSFDFRNMRFDVGDILTLIRTIQSVQDLHSPYKIYDECECADKTTPGHVEIHEIGTTCSHIYSICRECCADDGYQTEDCANYHTHELGEEHHCTTMFQLDKALRGEID